MKKASQILPMEITMDSAAMLKTVRELNGRYPFLTVTTLGKSILGKEIPVLILGHGKKKALYVGAHHGMEWITANLLLRFVNEFCELCQADRTVYRLNLSHLFQTYSIHVVPMLNPDGVDYAIHGTTPANPLYNRVIGMNGGSDDFSRWQANARGVDLNHNYNAGFAEYKRLEEREKIPCGAPTRFSGQEPESEPEVRALCNYIRFHVPIKPILTLHTQGEEIYWKSRGKTVSGSEAPVRKLASICGYTMNEAEGLASYGGLTDWCIETCNIPAVTLECGKGTNPLPVSAFFPIYARLREVLFVSPTLF